MVNITLKLGDCLELMKQLPDKSVDLIITDPPYGITKAKWDKVPDKRYFDQMFRVSKNQIIFGGNFFDLPHKSGWIVWYKRPFLKQINPIEFIWTSFNMHDVMLDYTYAGNVEGFNGNKLRPNYKKRKVFFISEKPVKVLEWLVDKYSKPSDVILDPFMGSGTTGVACVQLGRNFIGFEINPEHFKLAEKRINDAIKQKRLGD